MKKHTTQQQHKQQHKHTGRQDEEQKQQLQDDNNSAVRQAEKEQREVDSECETSEVKLPVKIALKPTVKESATVRRFDELALHPAAFYTQSADLAWEERNFATSADHSEPPFLLLRQDWKNPIALVHIARYGRQQREPDDLSPLHLLPVAEGSLAHTQTRGRGKTTGQRLETAQLYLSMCVGKWYELRAHSGWCVDGVEMRHFKGGRQVQRVELAIREMAVGSTGEDVAEVVAAMGGSGSGSGGVEAGGEVSDGSGSGSGSGGGRRRKVSAERGLHVSGVKSERVREEAVLDLDRATNGLSPSVSASLRSDVEAVQLLGALSQPQLVTAL